jgi:O-antigen ligase
MDKINQIFKSIGQLEPSESLERTILAQIETKKRLSLRQKLVLTYAGLIGSAMALIYALAVFGQTILQSDFWNLLTLLFSDAGIVLSNGNDFLFSLLENFPGLSLAAILIPIFLLMLFMSSYSKINYQRHKFI